MPSNRLLHHAKWLLLPWLGGSLGIVAQGAEVYRCDSAAGVSFQDRPCPPQQRQSRPRLAPAPTPSAPPASEPAVPEPAAATTGPAAPASAPAVAVAPPSFHLCRAIDGSRYQSASGVGLTRWVPYGVIDGHGQSLADAYGGPDGLATHPPGAANIPHHPAAPGSAAGYYVEVTDPCHRAAPAEACAWLRSELDTLDGRIRRAFSDTLPGLRQQRTEIARQLRGCP